MCSSDLLVVHGALMIEPTETESLETLDAFADAMLEIARDAESAPGRVKNAPTTTPLARLDETRAARHPILVWAGRADRPGDDAAGR